MQNQGNESKLFAHDVMHESKEVNKGWRIDEMFEERFEDSKNGDSKENLRSAKLMQNLCLLRRAPYSQAQNIVQS